MRLFGKDLSHEVAIVAEVGVNHEGNIDAALRLVALAAETGADAVKFQSYTAERFASANDPARLDRVRRFGLDVDAHRKLAREAERRGIRFFSTAVTEDWVPLLAELGEAIKIASGDLTFEPVIRAAAATGRPVIVSTGLGTSEEVDAAVAWVRDEIGQAPLAERLVLMQCVSAYPAPLQEVNLLAIPFLRARHGVSVGYSNHVIGLEACLAAVALGAPLIEAHFTDAREQREFRDHHLALLPAEMAELVTRAAAVRAALGSFGKAPQPSELAYRDIVRKGVVAARDLPAGKVLARDDLMFARPATEYPACDVAKLVGRRLTRALRLGELVPRSGVEG